MIHHNDMGAARQKTYEDLDADGALADTSNEHSKAHHYLSEAEARPVLAAPENSESDTMCPVVGSYTSLMCARRAPSSCGLRRSTGARRRRASAGMDATASLDCRARACVPQWKRLGDNGSTTPMEPLPTPVMSAFMEYLMEGNVVSRHGGNAGNLRP